MNKEQLYRHELKYRCTGAQLLVLKNRLDAVMALDTHAGSGGYTIRSLYFDDLENSCFGENESGTDPREKFRVRIYNADPSRITLECKRKEHSKTLKTACRLTRQQFDGILMNRCPLSKAEDQALLNKFLYLQSSRLMRPAVIVEYDRIPYVCSAGNVRITLDQNIRSSGDFSRFFEASMPSRPVMPMGEQLLEVKYDSLLPQYIRQILSLDHLQQVTFSKYYLCRRFSYGGML